MLELAAAAVLLVAVVVWSGWKLNLVRELRRIRAALERLARGGNDR